MIKTKAARRAQAMVCGLFLLGGVAIAGVNDKPESPLGAPVNTQASARIDELIESAARKEKIEPTAVCDDNTFLRRVTVDLIGRIPTAEEYQEFISDSSPDRRSKWIRKLLASPRFADRWAVFFGDMLRVRPNEDGGRQLAAFVKSSLDENKPYDKMVREMLLSGGTASRSPSVGFLMAENADPFEMAGVTSQVLLGVRMKCAQCHDHPFDIWTREDYYDLAAYFGKTSLYRREKPRIVAVTEGQSSRVLWPPVAKDGETQQPRKPNWPFEVQPDTASDAHIKALVAKRTAKKTTNVSVDDLVADVDRRINATVARRGGKDEALALADQIESDRKRFGETMSNIPNSENRAALADLITNPRNRYFTWNLSNRLWAELMGHGFVEPVDDFRGDNLPSHPEVLDYLADQFIANGYDFRALVELIVNSKTYQRTVLTDVAAEDRKASELLFASAPLRRMPAEALYDSMTSAGHLFDFKHPAGVNIREVTVTVAVPRTPTPAAKSKLAEVGSLKDAGDDKSMAAAAPKPMVVRPYSVEDAIEAQVPLTAADEAMLALDKMEVKSNEEIEAEMMMAESGPTMRYDYKQVKQTFDDNPKFSSAFAMALPAPPEHFLRQFGQTGRGQLGEQRDNASTTRQALILLNGKLSNEAARVGKLEPIAALLQPGKPIEPAIQFAYVEILTRQPTSEELADAKAIIEGAESREAGMADLRWALLNCHEFRFMP